MNRERFLYEELDALSKYGDLPKKIPAFVKDNLRFRLRPCQEEALARFFYCFERDFPGKTSPLHLAFNMATGSGKTMVMAGLILYLYKKGYRNFLFFVNSSSIIEKTKSNFLDPGSSKYLFSPNIAFGGKGGKRVPISPLENFEGANENSINICFTTIQKLHSDLTAVRENALSFQDFKDKKIALLSDEAHHMSAKTKQQMELAFKENPTWENTVERIFSQNRDSLLLEFTATLDCAHPNIAGKYRGKILYRYDLKKFRSEGWSKDVYIVQADFEQKDRILQALILSQYKQEAATKRRIRLKPVVLLKAQKTIQQNRDNKKAFHKMIESLSQADIERIKARSSLPVVQKAFAFFKSRGISDSGLAARLKEEFQPSRCLSANNESEIEKNQILLNTLEDKDNLIRAVFSVQKLSEGWDVLNLFDIVRCYETKSSGGGTTAMREAQLIGRGARYFPFALPPSAESASPDGFALEETSPFKRKFDHDLNHELRVLEELHYHSINDSQYISEITEALTEAGIMEEKRIAKRLELKGRFKQTDFYKRGLIYINKRVRRRYNNVRSILGLSGSANYQRRAATGRGAVSRAFSETGEESGAVKGVPEGRRRQVKLSEIPFHIVQNAVSGDEFFSFRSLKKHFPHIQSVREFIEGESCLGGLAITFQGGRPSNRDFLEGVSGLLEKIKTEMRENSAEYKGTENFEPNLVRRIFTDKEIKTSASRASSGEDFVSEKDWHVFKAFYGTSEERAFVQMLDSQMDRLREKYDGIYLVRNEKHFKIYNFKDGRGFEPDFVLFLREKGGQPLAAYQMFIEPKGRHLTKHDKWKEDFLMQIREKFKGRTLDFTAPAGTQKYRLTGVRFYNNEDENQFRESFFSALGQSGGPSRQKGPPKK